MLEIPQRMVMWDFTQNEPVARFLDHIEDWFTESGFSYYGYVITHRERWPKKWLYVDMPKDKLALFKLRWL